MASNCSCGVSNGGQVQADRQVQVGRWGQTLSRISIPPCMQLPSPEDTVLLHSPYQRRIWTRSKRKATTQLLSKWLLLRTHVTELQPPSFVDFNCPTVEKINASWFQTELWHLPTNLSQNLMCSQLSLLLDVVHCPMLSNVIQTNLLVWQKC